MVLETNGEAVKAISWSTHVRWLSDNFFPGQHITVLNPTGGGKSYLVINGILKLPMVQHARILFIDDKGNDKTTRKFGMAVSRYPPPATSRIFKRRRDTVEHYRLVVPDWHWTPDQSRSDVNVQHARSTVGYAFQKFYDEAQDPTDEDAKPGAKASIVVIDETFALTQSRSPSLDLAPLVRNGLRKGRYRGLSMICLSQAPLDLPSDVYHQPTHLYLGQMQDKRYRERLREIGGNTKVIEDTVAFLEDREFLFLGNKGRVMQIVMVGR